MEPHIMFVITARNRPKYLLTCLQSVLENAREHRHTIQVVVSDLSTHVAKAKDNESFVEKMRLRFTETPIHYYGPWTQVEMDALNRASPEQINALRELVPADGHWGMGRNRLEIAAAPHIVPKGKTYFIHLDDDMALWDLDGKGRKARHQRDHIGLFLAGMHEAELNGKKGFKPVVQGVAAGFVSLNQVRPGDLEPMQSEGRRKNLRQILEANATVGQWGSAKIVDYDGFKAPYRPYGLAEDKFHTQTLGGLHAIADPQKNPGVVHLGINGDSGLTEAQRKSLRTPSGPIKEQITAAWEKLINQLAGNRPA